MPLVINGNTVPPTNTVTYNGTSLTKIVCNGSTVWNKAISTKKVSVTAEMYVGGASTTYPNYNSVYFFLSTSANSFTKIRAEAEVVLTDGTTTTSATITPNENSVRTTVGMLKKDTYMSWNTITFYDEYNEKIEEAEEKLKEYDVCPLCHRPFEKES